MIIPRGTEIRLNEEGQLSIKTPGNLVIQNSGNYSEIESTNGSIRIEEHVKVDAVSVRAGQACFIQGTLTAWRVAAKKIALEDRARAYIMLQESESLDLSPTSRLVGNFANEKEVYLLLGKFNRQLRQLPGAVGMAALEEEESVAPENGEKAIDAVAGGEQEPDEMAARAAEEEPEEFAFENAEPEDEGEREEPSVGESDSDEDRPEPIRQAISLIEIELNRSDLDSSSQEAFRELLYALRSGELKRAEIVYRDAFTSISTHSNNLRRAYELLDGYFEGRES
ncbi:MAG: hypothetical protein R3338_03350 [Thermoanaerobaculia bacterium]|nr:hypothetical protein [Thermoanaerobaculia bacterium]